MSPVPHYECENVETPSMPSRTEISLTNEEVMIEKKNILSPEDKKEPDKECNDKIDVSEIESDSIEPVTERIVPPPVTLEVKSYSNLNGVDLFEVIEECEKQTNDHDKKQSDSEICDKTLSDRAKVVNGEQTPSDVSQGDGHHLPRDTSMDTLGEMNVVNNLADIAQRDTEACGCPLQLFDDVSDSKILFYRVTQNYGNILLIL